MEDSNNLLEINPISPSSSSKIFSTNEISIRNHIYIISIRVDHFEEAQLEIKVQSKENVDQWKSTLNSTMIEKMTAKTGSFKTFDVFVNMLEDAINQRNTSVSIDLFTNDDLQLLREKQQISKEKILKNISRKRYLILIYNVEYDRIYYPLSLHYSTKPNSDILIEQIRQLTTENQLLKSQLETNLGNNDLKIECARLKKENEEYREQIQSLDSNEKDRQIEFLREMIRTSENNLSKEQIHLKRTKRKKDDRYKKLLNQIESLKISERQLKIQVQSLTNEMNLNKKSFSPRKISGRSSNLSGNDRRRYHSANIPRSIHSSTESHVRFNPTAYVQQRTLKLQQIQLQKEKETQRKLNSGRCHSDSNTSDLSIQSYDIPQRQIKQKRMKNHHRRKSKDSIDSDIERFSSPPILRKGTFNNSTILHSHDDHQNVNSNSMIDIDQRLKSLEKFIKHNFLH